MEGPGSTRQNVSHIAIHIHMYSMYMYVHVYVSCTCVVSEECPMLNTYMYNVMCRQLLYGAESVVLGQWICTIKSTQ